MKTIYPRLVSAVFMATLFAACGAAIESWDLYSTKSYYGETSLKEIMGNPTLTATDVVGGVSNTVLIREVDNDYSVTQTLSAPRLHHRL